jgi:protein phosphatase
MADPAKTTVDLGAKQLFRVDASFLSDKGPARHANEDAAAVVVPADSSILAAKGVLAVVADGMGGHRAGRTASSMAVATVVETFFGGHSPVKELLIEAFHKANSKIFGHTRAVPGLDGMGTTCTALAVQGGFAWSAHVGDSRIYLVRGGCSYRMTEEHSATMRLVDMGLLTLEEAGRHEHRNVILRAVGTHDKLEVAVWPEPFPVCADDCFVVCSDGLHDIVADEEIAALSTAGATAEQACRALLDAALSRDCTDNVTVAVVRIAGVSRPQEGAEL